MKPTAMLEDALRHLSNRGDFVFDPFLGSGSTLIAAQSTGRVCRGVELDPLYVDVIIRRYEAASGEAQPSPGPGKVSMSWRRGAKGRRPRPGLRKVNPVRKNDVGKR